MTDGSIGVFDSGVGGLTVARRIMERLPCESLVYLGDTARVPYGTKSSDTIIRYALACARMLTARGVKMLVVACNTASACALDALRDELDIPVVGVIEPGARAAVAQSRSGRIGVIGTHRTVQSGEYEATIRSLRSDAVVTSKACPLFVPLAEEGWTSEEIPRRVAQEYLAEFVQLGIDTLVLGCTHYPLLSGVIAEVMGEGTCLVDSAEATSEVVAEIVGAMDIAARDGETVRHTFLVSDEPNGFAKTGRAFLLSPIEHVEWVDF